MTVDAVENATIGGEVEGDERKKGRERRGVEFRVDVEFVGAQRQDRAEPLLLLEERGADVDEARLENGAYVALHFVDFLPRVAVDGEVETDIKDALLRLLERVAQLLEVGVGGIEHRIANHSLLFARRDLALHFRDFFLEFTEHFIGVHGVHEDRDVDDLVHVDDGCEPPRREEARVRNDEECAGYFFTQVELTRVYLECVRGDDILQVQYARLINLFGQDRQNVRSRGRFFYERKKIAEAHRIACSL